MDLLYLFVLLVYEVNTKNVNIKEQFCANLNCGNDINATVCGIREEREGFGFKIFHSECELLKFGCKVESKDAYGIIDIKHCVKAFPDFFDNETETFDEDEEPNIIKKKHKNPCAEIDCSDIIGSTEVCGIRKEGPGFKIRLFPNKCELTKYNCVMKLEFRVTDFFICNGLDRPDYSTLKDSKESKEHIDELNNIEKTSIENSTPLYVNLEPEDKDFEIPANDASAEDGSESSKVETTTPNDRLLTTHKVVEKNIVVIDGSMLDFTGDINETMNNFFAATHQYELPLREVTQVPPGKRLLNETSRRMLIKIAKPVKVFQPWIVKPNNVSTDRYHEPTLSSCYHKCPVSCPDTYAPVCGVPGIMAREPSLMFKNHCYMDVAQCKMRWEDLSSTAESSSYIESSFLICLGDAFNAMYRFLPLVRTLQHMGRLKKKGVFHYKMRNMGFVNNVLLREPKLMG